MRKVIILISLFFILLTQSPALAQSGPGVFILPNETGFTNPVTGQTVIWDFGTNAWKVWNGTNYQQIAPSLNNFAGSVDPSAANDLTQGYGVGSFWENTTSASIFVCSSNAASAAVWQPIANSAALKLTYADFMTDALVSGLVGSVPVTSLTMITPGGTAYVSGTRISPAASTFTYTASKDTYDYLQESGLFNHVAVNNGGPQPIGQPGLLIQKVVSNGTQITAVTLLANTAPQISVANATSNNQAINLGQANAIYIPTSIITSVGDLIVGSGLATVTRLSEGTNDQVTGVAHTGTGLEYKSIVGGSGIAVTNSAGQISIASTSGGGSVTNVSGPAGILTWAAPTTMPAATASSISAHAWLGNNTSGAAPWAAESITAGDLPSTTVNSTGNLSPLFTASITTQALGYVLSNAAAGTIFGNFSGSTGAPSYNAPGTADFVLGSAHTGGGLEYKQIAAGSGITVTPTAGVITITSIAGGGSVTSFSSGNLAPLFTTSVATATSTPAQTYTAVNQSPALVYAGPISGGAAAPTFRALVASDLPAGASGFGGNGADGAIIISSATSDASIVIRQTTSFTINVSKALAVHQGSLIESTGAVTINGSLTSSSIGDISGGAGGGTGGSGHAYAAPGQGPAGGQPPYANEGSFGGGGGGNGGAGGTGGNDGSNNGAPGGAALSLGISCGSGGGGGADTDGSQAGGSGGPAGNTIKIIAIGAISEGSGAVISSNGSGGLTVTTGGGGGGGSGGSIFLYSQTSITTVSGGLSATGGPGGSSTSGAGGAGGGGGWFLAFSPSNSIASVTLTGGAAGMGAGGAPTAGTSGQSLSITGTPSLPLISYVESHLPQLAAVPCYKTPGYHEFKKSDICAIAAEGDFLKFAALMTDSDQQTCFVGDFDLVPSI